MIDRAYGALVGGAIGDAMGMPASFFTRDKIKQVYGYITDFLEPEVNSQVYHGSLKAGEITDDTMESIIISNILIKMSGNVDTAFDTPGSASALTGPAIQTDRSQKCRAPSALNVALG